jgi:hypothetical protein
MAMKSATKLIMMAAIFAGPQFLVTGGAVAGDTQAQVAYNACTASYNSNRQSLTSAWAFVSGVSGDQNQCYWAYAASSTADAVNTATANCQKDYSDCFTYATSDGWSDWVTRISNNGGSDPGNTSDDQAQNDSPTPDCQAELFKEGMGIGAGIAALATHQNFTPPDVDPSKCEGQ